MSHRNTFNYVTDRQSSDLADDWRTAAVCRDDDPELHFPIGSAGPARRQEERAKANCRRCKVTEECLIFALQTGAVGVWGNTSEDERRGMPVPVVLTAARS